MCALDRACSSYAAGHAMHLIQLRLAAATPQEWADAVVTAVSPSDRTVTVTTLDGLAVTLWNSAYSDAAPSPGEPVALHRRYRVLATGTTRVNVAVLAEHSL